MQVTLIYFSQTGNTEKVAKVISQGLTENGCETTTLSLKKVTAKDIVSADLIGVGTPCFECQAPSPVRNFLRNLPSLKGKKAFVFATSGGAPGRVLYDLTQPIETKGAAIIGGFICRGENFHPAPCLVGRFPKRPTEMDLQEAKNFAVSLLRHVASGTFTPMPESRPDTFKLGVGFYQMCGLILKGPVVRFLMPEPRLNPDKCTQCDWCIYECPVGNLTKNPFPKPGDKCLRCYRCYTGCPEKAFEIKWGISNFLTWTLYNQTFEKWFGDIRPGEKIYG
jgi:flavodoxin/NAD-dependent dihydropyrimidine dehydrogenase PreA subunit